MHRFFVPPDLLKTIKSDIVLPKNLAHQVRDVLHLHIDERLLLLDNSGDEFLATVTRTSRTSVEVYLHERRPGKSEPTVRVILCQGLLKSARFEWILEKGTELGVSVFSPIICRRSSVGLEDAGPTKIQRWQRIIQEAAEQSGRSHLPELLPIRHLTQALNDLPSNDLAIMPWEEEHALTLHDVLSTAIRPAGNVEATLAVAKPTIARPTSTISPTSSMPSQPTQSPSTPIPQSLTVVLLIGPEGGLIAEEITLAKQHGVYIVTLGSRILRAETAALATIANVMYKFDR
jgi:16S rRNA (uracil1498-N3)-methyltransferase